MRTLINQIDELISKRESEVQYERSLESITPAFYHLEPTLGDPKLTFLKVFQCLFYRSKADKNSPLFQGFIVEIKNYLVKTTEENVFKLIYKARMEFNETYNIKL